MFCKYLPKVFAENLWATVGHWPAVKTQHNICDHGYLTW